jgi:hypothetical protein
MPTHAIVTWPALKIDFLSGKRYNCDTASTPGVAALPFSNPLPPFVIPAQAGIQFLRPQSSRGRIINACRAHIAPIASSQDKLLNHQSSCIALPVPLALLSSRSLDFHLHNHQPLPVYRPVTSLWRFDTLPHLLM